MSRSEEIKILRQEAELLRAAAVEKGILSQRLADTAWTRIARVLNIADTTCK
jgi:hypothetical protein